MTKTTMCGCGQRETLIEDGVDQELCKECLSSGDFWIDWMETFESSIDDAIKKGAPAHVLHLIYG